MANNKEEKKKIVAEIGEKIKNGSSFVLVDYKGITVAEDTVLRNAFRKEGVDYKVYKNRYLKIALNNLGYTDYDEFLNGTTAIAIGTDNPLAPAKIVTDKIAEFKKMTCKCGMLDKKFVDAATVSALAKIPSKEVLIAQLLGMLQSPIRKLAVALNAVAEKQK